MIMIGDEGNVTDIQGVPIVDKSGNMIILNLKQIKKMLDKEEF